MFYHNYIWVVARVGGSFVPLKPGQPSSSQSLSTNYNMPRQSRADFSRISISSKRRFCSTLHTHLTLVNTLKNVKFRKKLVTVLPTGGNLLHHYYDAQQVEESVHPDEQFLERVGCWTGG